jgi:hypothetical protein
MKKCFLFTHHPFLLVVLMTVVGSLWPSSIAATTLLLLRISHQTVVNKIVLATTRRWQYGVTLG